MGFLLLTTLGMIALLGIPTISGLFARRIGRRFWVWFLIGCILPIVSAFIIFFLPDLSEIKEEKVVD